MPNSILIERISDELSVNYNDAENLLKHMFESITAEILKGKSFYIDDIGNISIKYKSASYTEESNKYFYTPPKAYVYFTINNIFVDSTIETICDRNKSIKDIFLEKEQYKTVINVICELLNENKSIAIENFGVFFKKEDETKFTPDKYLDFIVNPYFNLEKSEIKKEKYSKNKITSNITDIIKKMDNTLKELGTEDIHKNNGGEAEISNDDNADDKIEESETYEIIEETIEETEEIKEDENIQLITEEYEEIIEEVEEEIDNTLEKTNNNGDNSSKDIDEMEIVNDTLGKIREKITEIESYNKIKKTKETTPENINDKIFEEKIKKEEENEEEIFLDKKIPYKSIYEREDINDTLGKIKYKILERENYNKEIKSEKNEKDIEKTPDVLKQTIVEKKHNIKNKNTLLSIFIKIILAIMLIFSISYIIGFTIKRIKAPYKTSARIKRNETIYNIVNDYFEELKSTELSYISPRDMYYWDISSSVYQNATYWPLIYSLNSSKHKINDMIKKGEKIVYKSIPESAISDKKSIENKNLYNTLSRVYIEIYPILERENKYKHAIWMLKLAAYYDFKSFEEQKDKIPDEIYKDVVKEIK